jgi:hypothetical protein
MHKNKALPERPKPPPFDEIIHDIEKCPDQSESKLINGVAGKTTGHLILI